MYTEHVLSPTLIFNESVARANIYRMVTKAKRNGFRFRPHFKTHQSARIGDIFRDVGVKCITVSSVDQAVYFADAGWNDITIAFPCNVRELKRLNALASRIKLGVVVQAVSVVRKLEAGLKEKVNVWIEADVGDERSGLHWKDAEGFRAVAEAVRAAKQLDLAGILSHSGFSYQARGPKEIMQVHHSTMARLSKVKGDLSMAGFKDLAVSTGDTPTCSVAENFPGIDEVRPGNFVFYDLMQVQIGSCRFEDIAIALACPVVAKIPERMELILHGGAVHFSKEYILDKAGNKVYGKLAWPKEETTSLWGSELEGCYMRALSQEHGVAKVSPAVMDQVEEGDLLMVLPVHSCLTADLTMEMYRPEDLAAKTPATMMKHGASIVNISAAHDRTTN